MKIKIIPILFAFLFISSNICFGQDVTRTVKVSPNQVKVFDRSRPKGKEQKYVEIKIKPGETIEIIDTNRGIDSIRMYNIQSSVKTEFNIVISATGGKISYGLGSPPTGEGDDYISGNGPNGEIIYTSSPPSQTVEEDNDFFIAVKVLSPKVNYKITVSAKKIVYSAYSLQTCLGKIPVNIGVFTDSSKILVDTLSASKENYQDLNGFVSVSALFEVAANGDLNGDGFNDIAIITECTHGSNSKLSYYTLHILNLKVASKLETAQIKLPIENSSENGLYSWQPDPFNIKNQKLDILFNQYKSDGEGQQKTGKSKKLSYRLINNNLVDANKFSQQQPKTVRDIQAQSFPEPYQPEIKNQNTTENQLVNKAGFRILVPSEWQTVEENANAISMAPPKNITSIGDKNDLSFGIIAGITDIKPNEAKNAVNTVLNMPVMNTKGLDDATKWLVKETVKQIGYKQIGKIQDITFNGNPAKQTQIQGNSKATGKSETILIITTLTKDNRLLYVQAVYPSDSTTADLKVFDEIRASIKIP